MSIVNVGSTAFLRYSNIFLRQDDKELNLNVSLITDVDVKSSEHTQHRKEKDDNGEDIEILMTKEEIEAARVKKLKEKKDYYEKPPVTAFIAPYWTLEYSIARSCLSELFYQAVYICYKSKSRDYVYSEKEKVEFIEEAKRQYKKWTEEDNLSVDEIAYNIYKKTMLDKKISKAVVAQVFADIIIGANFDRVEEDENLTYLVDAIKNVTGN
uniref:Uncharacterized protein n=1 Tax=Aliivibrio wodanis TaxID=80852 RepID=A0A5Q4YZ34_9GAMM|nr:hypothetical protein AW0309160_03660 [Aliivibrio wodanis]